MSDSGEAQQQKSENAQRDCQIAHVAGSLHYTTRSHFLTHHGRERSTAVIHLVTDTPFRALYNTCHLVTHILVRALLLLHLHPVSDLSVLSLTLLVTFKVASKTECSVQ
ncbi:hypothetical protein J6590_060077 [Homalodisca vitripennis]|nr:hypothetical protein J6590_101988 [Homalodisca vitripennis]KAG8320830.1 hypothetical protein J6590_060077 [Homalodisca vitripennis]